MLFRHPYLSIILVTLTSFVALSACAGSDAGTPAVVRDSAGITIVENPAPGPSSRTWTLGDAPEVAIGVLDGPEEQQLFQVNAVARLPDGRIAIANDGTKEVRFFDSAGRFLAATGRDGEGPGEFRSLFALHVWADSILVGDFQLSRASVSNLNGEFVRSFALSEPGGRAFPTIAAMFGDGTLLVRAASIGLPGRRGAGLRPDSMIIFHVDRQGLILDTLGTFLGRDMYVHAEGPRVSVSSAPFGRSPNLAATDQRFYYGSGDRFEIQARGPGGALERLVRLDRSPRAVTPDDIERLKRQRLDAIDDGALAARTERVLAQMPFPSTMPAFSAFVVDAEGNLWVGSYRPTGEESTTWTVFEPDGRLLAEVDTPPRFTVFQIGEDWILGRRSDDLDVERVELYRLQKPAT